MLGILVVYNNATDVALPTCERLMNLSVMCQVISNQRNNEKTVPTFANVRNMDTLEIFFLGEREQRSLKTNQNSNNSKEIMVTQIWSNKCDKSFTHMVMAGPCHSDLSSLAKIIHLYYRHSYFVMPLILNNHNLVIMNHVS